MNSLTLITMAIGSGSVSRQGLWMNSLTLITVAIGSGSVSRQGLWMNSLTLITMAIGTGSVFEVLPPVMSQWLVFLKPQSHYSDNQSPTSDNHFFWGWLGELVILYR